MSAEERQWWGRALAVQGDVSSAIARSGNQRAMLQACTEALVTGLDLAFARIWTVNHAGTVLELQASAGLYTHIDGAHARVQMGALKIGVIAQKRRPHLTNDVLGDERIQDRAWAQREGMVAFAGYPLIVDDRVVGVLAMFARRPLSAETLDVLGPIVSLVAEGIERRRSEDQLRRSEAYLAEGQRLSKTGSWSWRLDTGERFWSQEVYRIYGFEGRENPPPLEAVLQRVHPRDAARVRRIVDDALRTSVDFRFETRVRVDRQPVKYVETIGHPIRDESGRLVEFIGTDVDITERRRAEKRLRRAVETRYAAVLDERTRIARDMHDGLLQDVTGIALQLAALLPHIRSNPDASAEKLKEILALTERVGREARQAVAGMRAVAESQDLVTAVEIVARRIAGEGSLTLSCTVKGRTRPVSPAIGETAIAIVQEGMTNVRKHAGAQGVEIRFHFARTRLRLTIVDDGRGLPARSLADGGAGHFGLVGMRERAASVKGTLEVRSVPGHGTRVVFEVPYGA